MGIHEYPCPICQSKQRVRAETGEVVEIKACQACAEAQRIAGLETESLEAEVNEALDRHEGKKRR